MGRGPDRARSCRAGQKRTRTPGSGGMTSRGPILITGGAGFIGSNLADRLASDGQHVLVFDALARRGVVRNPEWLLSRSEAGRVGKEWVRTCRLRGRPVD